MPVDHNSLFTAIKAAVPSPPDWCLFWRWSSEVTCMPRSEWASWAQAGGAFLGMGVAIAAPLIVNALERRKRRLGYLELIAVDVRLAQALAATYLRGKVISPAYRLPLLGVSEALPSLLADGCLNIQDASYLAGFYVDAKSFNGCLDLTAELRREGGKWQAEESRNRKKAVLLVSKADHAAYDVPKSRPSRFDEAMAVLGHHLPQKTLERLEFRAAPEDE